MNRFTLAGACFFGFFVGSEIMSLTNSFIGGIVGGLVAVAILELTKKDVPSDKE